MAENNNSVTNVARLKAEDLKKFNGIGDAKAVILLAAFELGRRRKDSNTAIVQIKSSADTYSLMRGKLEDLTHEEFWVVYLNRSNAVVDIFKLSQGGISGTVIDIKLIAKRGIDKLASSLILLHNHPGNSIKPSRNDIEITKKIEKACSMLDLNLLDHLIITSSSYYSFCDEGML